MQIKLAYGKEGLEIRLPDNLNLKVLESEYISGLADPTGAVREALRSPTGSQPLKSLVQADCKIGIVLSDITRPAPNRVFMSALKEELAPISPDRIVLFIATGTHRANTETELREMLGNQTVDRCRIVQNSAIDRDSHVLVGRTRGGKDIWLHDEYVKCDVRILTGFIEPHFFSGFSGGGKACMPGLALLETICRNHSVKNIESPTARWGVTYGNPLWEEILEAASIVPPTFLLNVSLNRDKQITGVFAGDLEKAHARGCALVREMSMVPVKEAFDIVLSSSSGYPLDLNLYQSVKGMSAAANVVRKGGSIIIAADCWDGIPEHGEYGKLLGEAKDPQSLLKTIRAPGYQRQDMWQAQIHAQICRKAEVYFYSRNLSDEQIESAFLKPCHDLEATVAELIRKHGAGASVCILPEGPQTIPYIRR
ncbi:MAG TPA: nickel-dependent lactate racemase [archaeon]|nr:nickel-dependent lactate racemase [archaeon]